MLPNFQFCDKLRTIPANKYSTYKQDLLCEDCKKKKFISCEICNIKSKLIDRYYETNIPIDFWFRSVEEFEGDARLVERYNYISENLSSYYKEGKSLFLKGQHGVGKTYFACLVLKEVVKRGFSGLYVNLYDIVSTLTQSSFQTKFEAGRELKMTDFLVIDEFDPRFFGSDASGELYGRILESIIRNRFQNKLCVIILSNNPNPMKNVSNDLAASLDSLLTGNCETINVIGRDFRKTK